MKQHYHTPDDDSFAALSAALRMLSTPETAKKVGRTFSLYRHIEYNTEFTAAIQGDVVYVVLPFAPHLVIGAVRTIEQFDELHARWHARLDPLIREDADPTEIAGLVIQILTRGEL